MKKTQQDKFVAAAARLALVPFLSLVTLLPSAAAHAERMASAEPQPDANTLHPLASWQTRRVYAQSDVALAMSLPTLEDAVAAGRLGVAAPGEPSRVGFARELPNAYRGDLSRSLEWTTLSGGSQVAAFSVRSPDAGSMRLAVQARLPEGAVLRFFAPGDPGLRYPTMKPGAFQPIERDAETVPVRWSPAISGDTAGVEVEIPAGANPLDVSVQIVRISHIEGPSADSTADDPTCEPVQAICEDLPACPNTAVMMVFFTLVNGDSFACTGTALTSERPMSENRDRPFVLTAAHCIDSQAVAETVYTDWRYEYASCGAAELHPDRTVLHGGADMVALDADTDSVLLELRERLPSHACLAGWDSATEWAEGTEVSYLHHPLYGVKEWSGGRIQSYSPAGDVDTVLVDLRAGRLVGGSSGAGLFANDGSGDQRLMGVLHGGTIGECPIVGNFGRFDLFYVNQARSLLSPTEQPSEDDHGGTLEGATGIAAGWSVDAKIDHGRDGDFFRVEVPERGVLKVYTTGSLDTFGRLKRDDGSTFRHDDEGGYLSNFRIEAMVEPGTYFVKVTGFNNRVVGEYRLHVEFDASSMPRTVLVPLFLSASAWESDTGRQGFVRIHNLDSRLGEVRVSAIDDDGVAARDVVLTVGPWQTLGINSNDLENGNPQKGIPQGIGSGKGDWRLVFDSDVKIEVSAYIRTRDGFLSAIHDMATLEERLGAHLVPMFNPASNTNQRSLLRLINADAEETVAVTVFGIDDSGYQTGGVQFSLPPGAARTVDALELEQGGELIKAALGDGAGKWRLLVEAEGEIHVMSLLDSPTGSLTNLSRAGAVNYEQ